MTFFPSQALLQPLLAIGPSDAFATAFIFLVFSIVGLLLVAAAQIRKRAVKPPEEAEFLDDLGNSNQVGNNPPKRPLRGGGNKDAPPPPADAWSRPEDWWKKD